MTDNSKIEQPAETAAPTTKPFNRPVPDAFTALFSSTPAAESPRPSTTDAVPVAVFSSKD